MVCSKIVLGKWKFPELAAAGASEECKSMRTPGPYVSIWFSRFGGPAPFV